jgi:predicted dehydrogenase
MTGSLKRRRFLGMAAAAGLVPGVSGAKGTGANETVALGVMGTGGRGTELARELAGIPGASVAAVCDVDRRRVARAAEEVNKVAGKTPDTQGDFRRLLDRRDLDAIVIAAADHWHAPATILACAAGKHVYVEKPCSHNPREGELMVEASAKHKRVVQLGTQRRSWPGVHEAIDRLHEGAIGRPYFALCRYHNNRPSIGRGKEGPAPEWLDYELWQGPAPRRPFRDNILHYNWHWFWDWGTGEIGNNGVHYLDVCRWGLGVSYPTRVSSGGGHDVHDDDQETPDTHVVTFDFDGRRSITFEGLSCGEYHSGPEMVFYGDKGALAISGAGYSVFDPSGKPVRKADGDGGDAVHLRNFLDAVRGGTPPNAPIAEGYISTLLCHLGNIAHRVGRSLRIDPKDGHVLDDPQARSLWSREYAPGWEPKA